MSDANKEAQRIIRISDEVRLSLERVTSEPEAASKDTDNGYWGQILIFRFEILLN